MIQKVRFVCCPIRLSCFNSRREQMEQSGAHDNEKIGSGCCCAWKLPLRNRRLRRSNTFEHSWAVRPENQQMDCRCSDVDETKTSWLCGFQQLHLCSWRTWWLHGVVVSWEIQVRKPFVTVMNETKLPALTFSPNTNSWAPIVAMTSRRSGVSWNTHGRLIESILILKFTPGWASCCKRSALCCGRLRWHCLP